MKIHNTKFLILLTFLLVVIACKTTEKEISQEKLDISKELKWSERMAQTLMKAHPESWQIDDKTEPKWDYVHGLVLTGFQETYQSTKKEEYVAYVESYVDGLINEDGSINTYKYDTYNIDMINAGKLLFDVYESTEDEKYLKAMQLLRQQIEEQPRTPSGGFWHKKRYPNQMWLDGLYMGAPFYTRYTMQFEEGAALDDIVKQFDLIQKHTLDSETGLLYHGWDESKEMEWANDVTGTSPNFWSRSMGWYMMALVDVLEYFPESHEGHARLVQYLNELTDALEKFQHESGLWYQVTDQGDREGNYLEASGTAMFTYAIAKGVNQGYLPKEYMAIAQKGFSGLTEDLMEIGENGETVLTQVCAVAGLGGNPYRDGSFDYYVNERKKNNDPKGTGPFILAALELNK